MDSTLHRVPPSKFLLYSDFIDLFSTLIVSLPLTPHRYRLQKINHSFTSQEAIANLSSLRISQSTRIPDPSLPSRFLTTTTTTIFSMPYSLARSLCNKFYQAHLIAPPSTRLSLVSISTPASPSSPPSFSDKNAVWVLTPKGLHLLSRFCQRNGISQPNILPLLQTTSVSLPRLLILERDSISDLIYSDQSTVHVIFQRFASPSPNITSNHSSISFHPFNHFNSNSNSNSLLLNPPTPNVPSVPSAIANFTSPSHTHTSTSNQALPPLQLHSTTSSSSNSSSNSSDSQSPSMSSIYSTYSTESDARSPLSSQSPIPGVKLERRRKIHDKAYWHVFSGKTAVDWLLDCSTVIDLREAVQIASLFLHHNLIQPVISLNSSSTTFSPTKDSLYCFTPKGRKVAGWVPNGSSQARSHTNSSSSESNTQSRPPDALLTASSASRMSYIIHNPAFRLLFREYLRLTHCEENLSFFLEVQQFLVHYRSVRRAASAAAVAAAIDRYYICDCQCSSISATSSTVSCSLEYPCSPRFVDLIRETLAAAYNLYNSFLAPGSPSELNIDHALRTTLASRMTRAVVGQQTSSIHTPIQSRSLIPSTTSCLCSCHRPSQSFSPSPSVSASTASSPRNPANFLLPCLDEVASLFARAQAAVFRLMASDSAPKFVREPRYAEAVAAQHLLVT